jgi:hypothetical protein
VRVCLFVDASSAIFLTAILLGCCYCFKRICPQGPIFTSLELDDIRLERYDDIEQGIEENIKLLKDKLAYHRRKKTGVQTDRDIRMIIGQHTQSFNDKGRANFGEAWDKGGVPVRYDASVYLHGL